MVVFVYKDKTEPITYPNAAKSIFYNTQRILLYIFCLAELLVNTSVSANSEISINKVKFFMMPGL